MKSALITGASRGIGRGIAFRLAQRGFALTITSRKPDDLAALAPDLRAVGAPQVVHHAADMADRAALAEVVDTHRTAFTTMNALVLSAGVGTAGPIETLPLHRFDRTVEVNLAAAFVLVQHSLPLLRAAAAADPDRGAKVVALASITGVYAEPGLAAYGASKAALISFMETLNAEESAHGVTATAIAPGYVNTDMSAWVTDTIPAHTMIPVADVVTVADMLLNLGPRTSIATVVMSRSGTTGYRA
jgi:3-oxoacyl-[acyl-carrier protein] reductase